MTKTKTFSAALAGLAMTAGLSALAFATGAAATEANPTSPYILLKSASMDQKYTAHVGVDSSHTVDAFSNGVTFSYQNATSTGAPIGGSNATVYTLFGFCVDVTHDMYVNQTLNYTYADSYNSSNSQPNDPLPTDFDSPTAHPISMAQLTQLNALIDTGWLLHEQELAHPTHTSDNDNIELQLAAIQAAIWHVEGAYVSIDNGSTTFAGSNFAGAISGSSTMSYAAYYADYSTGNFKDLGDADDTFYTIVQASPNYDDHQSFAVGWPRPGIPEPATWAMMLLGFGGLGAMLRARRARAALA